jgi:tetratricopeptide (TPR) repeat protein
MASASSEGFFERLVREDRFVESRSKALTIRRFPMSEPRNDAPDSLSPFQRAQMENYHQEARDAERAEQYSLAVELLERALKLDPRDYRCRVQLASLSNQLGNLPRALAIYKELLPDVKDDSMLFNNLGAVYFDLGALTKAVGYFQESIRCNPSNDLPHANLTYL